jgi:prephenate dehydrogenase
LAEAAPKSLLIFGGGWLGEAVAREAVHRGGQAVLTSRDPARRAALTAGGLTAIDPHEAPALASVVAAATAVVVTAPPGPSGCPGLAALLPPGWTVAAIDVERGRLILRQGSRSVTAEL